MKELLDKISSYNLFNYLIPGALFAFLAGPFVGLALLQKDIVVGFVLYYFLGMCISRFGSLILEPALKKMKVVTFAEYGVYVSALKRDTDIALLSEVNNTYRTLASLFVSLILLRLTFWVGAVLNTTEQTTQLITLFVGLIGFVLAYRKQTRYVSLRVQHASAIEASEQH